MIVQIIILNAAHDPLRELGVRYEHRILAKIFHLFVGAFVLSFWPAISVVWFGVNMSAATFFAYWAFEGHNIPYNAPYNIPCNAPYNIPCNAPYNIPCNVAYQHTL